MADIEIEINVQGLDELEETLIAGGKKAATSFLRKVERKVAKIALEAMQETVPIAEKTYRRGKDSQGHSLSIPPGTLFKSLKISSRATQNELTTHVGPATDENYIGRFSEFGTEKMPATHWMEQAWQLCKDELLDAYEQIGSEVLTDIASGAK